MCDNTRFLAGAAREDVTPKVGTCLYGYVPNHHSQSVHDGLSVTALALQSEKTKALIITAEIGNIQNELCDELRGAISAETGVPFENIVISCTHTHSAPNLTGSEGWGEVDRDYYDEFFAPGTLSAAKKAVSNLADAEIAVGVTQSLVGINRRQQHPDGSIGLGQNPHGCFDPNMTVVAIRNAQTKAGILNLIHYSCHGTSAGRNVEITRDWSGVMIDRLETETGTLTAFYNGACGDVGPRLTNGGTCGDIHHVEELGGLAATDAMRAYKARGGYHKGKLEVFTDTLHLPYAPLPTLAEVKEKLKEYPEPEKLFNLARMEYCHWKEVEEYLESGKTETPPPFTFPETIISLGDVLFIPYAYELFSEIQMRLREYSPFPYTLCLTNANGTLCYLPSEDQLCRGGYEVGCFRVGRLFPLASNTDHNLINETLRILRENGKV